MKVIGIDASRANLKKKTGTEWYTFCLLQELKKIIRDNERAKNVRFILYSEEDFDPELIENAPENFKFKVLKWSPKFLWTQLRLSWEMIWHRPDILYIPAHVMPFIHPQNTISTIHDIGFERVPEVYDTQSIGPKNIFIQSVLKIGARVFSLGKYSNTHLDYDRYAANFAVKHAQKIITVSEHARKDIADFYSLNPEKIGLIKNGFMAEKFLANISSDELLRVKNKFNITKPYIFYIGRLEAKKNVLNLVKAFNILKNKFNIDCQLVLAGSRGNQALEIFRAIKDYKLKNDVVEAGYVDEADHVALLKGSSLFTLPSLYEGFGVPVLEAQAVHIPVAASNSASLPEVVGQGGLTFDPYNPEDMSQTFQKILENNELKNQLIKAGLENITKYSWQDSAQKLFELLIKFYNK